MKKALVSLFFIFLFFGCIGTGEKSDNVKERIILHNQKSEGTLNKMAVIYALNYTVSAVCGKNCNSFYEASEPAIKVQKKNFNTEFQDLMILSSLLRECNHAGISDEDCTVSFAQPRVCKQFREINESSPFTGYACNYK
ncbi:hypothetical protein COU37_03115 [Candidatus Micrarchaeota archaeon CG10_big_fil_rev_8_21_14_0_10_45_29]|nr:MAG: hypothetical protein COU37_03115 [Candidatus Micrarchaeota archaeon CG10_big_fil_rev_8_21_14_0_10_45_29]QBM01568.1 hypothetical protein [uncultured archaeon]